MYIYIYIYIPGALQEEEVDVGRREALQGSLQGFPHVLDVALYVYIYIYIHMYIYIYSIRQAYNRDERRSRSTCPSGRRRGGEGRVMFFVGFLCVSTLCQMFVGISPEFTGISSKVARILPEHRIGAP